MRYGAIYIAHNPQDGNSTFKVGKTERSVDARMKELTSDTSNIGTYSALAYFIVIDVDSAEQACHNRLSRYRLQENREFFEIPLPRLIKIVKEEVQKFTASDSIPDIPEEIDKETDKNNIKSVSDLLKKARVDNKDSEKSWGIALNDAKCNMKQYIDLIENKIVEARQELKDEEILVWDVPNEIDIEASYDCYLTLCSVQVMSKFTKPPIVLALSGVRGRGFGDLDLSHAIEKPIVQSGISKDSNTEFVEWKEPDDGRIGRIYIAGHIQNCDDYARKEGHEPAPSLIVNAAKISYDDYHQNYSDSYGDEKAFSDPLEAFEVFIALIVENVALPQSDVRKQSGTTRPRHGEARPSIIDQGEFTMTALEEA